MKELDMKRIIESNFGSRIENIEEEGHTSIYEALRSVRYNDFLRKMRKRNVIDQKYVLSRVHIRYKGVKIIIKLEMPFMFYNEFLNNRIDIAGRVIVPIVGDLDELSIDVEFPNEVNKLWFEKKIPEVMDYIKDGENIKISRTTLSCKGYRKSMGQGKGKIDARIVDYVSYLFDCIDFAKSMGHTKVEGKIGKLFKEIELRGVNLKDIIKESVGKGGRYEYPDKWT